jgi:hypothetical protein
LSLRDKNFLNHEGSQRVTKYFLGFPLCSSPALHQTQCGASVVAFVVESFLPKVGLSELGYSSSDQDDDPQISAPSLQTAQVRRYVDSILQNWQQDHAILGRINNNTVREKYANSLNSFSPSNWKNPTLH